MKYKDKLANYKKDDALVIYLSNPFFRIFKLMLIVFLVHSCGGQPRQGADNVVQDTQQSTVQAMQNHPGERVYNQYCKACHMADGTGIRGMHPPLVNNKTVNGKTDKLIQVTMKGMSGKVVIDGVEYNGIMPPHTHLTNQQIADVITYIRQNFSNNAGPVTAEEVAKLR
jgi:mono/diheme cytochrome c family protein